jgi:hypothetical protein
MRGLKMRIPKEGLRIKLIPTEAELAECQAFGSAIAGELTGQSGDKPVIELADLN